MMNTIVWILVLISDVDLMSNLLRATVMGQMENTTQPALIDKCRSLPSPVFKFSFVGKNPFEIFTEWKQLADDCGIDGGGMTLATASKEGIPSVRNVVLAGEVTEGFVFYTHYTSLKGRDLEGNPVASALFFYNHDHPNNRQIILTGNVTKLTSLQSDTYWNSVPMDYRLLNYLNQGMQIRSRKIMTTMRSESLIKYQKNAMERPPTWGGYIIRPYVIEFSQGAPDMLRDRIVFKKLRTDETFNPVTMQRGVNGWVYHRILP